MLTKSFGKGGKSPSTSTASSAVADPSNSAPPCLCPADSFCDNCLSLWSLAAHLTESLSASKPGMFVNLLLILLKKFGVSKQQQLLKVSLIGVVCKNFSSFHTPC